MSACSARQALGDPILHVQENKQGIVELVQRERAQSADVPGQAVGFATPSLDLDELAVSIHCVESLAPGIGAQLQAQEAAA